MSMIKYIKGDLFSAPKGSILAHSCNCHGVWGGGVAAVFKAKYPDAYKVYHNHCAKVPFNEKHKLLGTCLLIDDKQSSNHIACLFTSGASSSLVDPPEQIVFHTKAAMKDLLNQLNEKHLDKEPIRMPKINAGIFCVPWEDTEKCLKELNHPCIVYEL